MPKPKTEEIPAEEVSVGDEIHFPNSRKPQKVEQVSQQGGITTLVAADATWQVTSALPVRRVIKVEETE